jgi:hypothetical protein
VAGETEEQNPLKMLPITICKRVTQCLNQRSTALAALFLFGSFYDSGALMKWLGTPDSHDHSATIITASSTGTPALPGYVPNTMIGDDFRVTSLPHDAGVLGTSSQAPDGNNRRPRPEG